MAFSRYFELAHTNRKTQGGILHFFKVFDMQKTTDKGFTRQLALTETRGRK
jgi:hypothetical protein